MPKKLTTEFVREFVALKGGRLLSAYVNSKAPLIIDCGKGHICTPCWSSLNAGRWCIFCSGKIRKTDEEVENFIKQRGGELLSKYKNAHTPLTIRCKNGHIFHPQWNHLTEGHWCGFCGKSVLYNTEYIRDVLGKLNYTLIGEYHNSSTKLHLICPNNHVWFVSWQHIKAGHNCPECFSKKFLKKDNSRQSNIVRETISKKGGRLISAYQSGKSKILVKCSNDHIWETTWHSIQIGYWCKICSGYKLSINDAINEANKRGGKLLSEVYVGLFDKLLWQCKVGHIFEKALATIRHLGTWCPDCFNSGKSEGICRLFFETCFGFSFKNKKFDWLINSRGYRLELDGYCSELGIGFEHQGSHHYSDGIYNSNNKSFQQFQKNDKEKLELCKKNHVKLYIIPELFSKTKICHFKDLIKQQSIELNILLPNNFDSLDVPINIIK